MLTARIGAVVSALLLWCALAGAQTAPPATNIPFSAALLAGVPLTAEQQTRVNEIIDNVNTALLVGVYPSYNLKDPIVDYPYMGEFPESTMPVYVPVDQAIALVRYNLQSVLAQEHPNPIAAQGYAMQITDLQQTQRDIIATGYQAIARELTPAQRQAMLPMPTTTTVVLF